MAYVQGGLDDENKNNVAVNGGGSSVHLAPSSGVGSVGAGAGTSNNGQGAGGGSFATINQYLNANQDQAQPLANQLTAGINQQYNTLSGQNDKTVSDLNSAVNSGYTKQDNNVLAQEAANPTSFAQDTNNVTNFQGQLNDKYTGPQSAEGTDAFTKQQAALNSAISQGKSATQTEAGRQGLLTGVEKTQTPGVSALNSAILSSDPNSQSQIEHAYDPFSGLVSGLSASGQKIDQNITGAQKEAQGASQSANQQIQGQVSGLNNAVGKNTQALQDQFNGYNSNLSSIQNNALNPQTDINAFSASTGVQGIKNPFADIMSLMAAQNAPTAANSSSADQYQLAGALNTLSPGAQLTLDPSQSSMAGTYQAPAPLAAPNIQQLLEDWGQNNFIPQLGAFDKAAPGNNGKSARPLYDLFNGLKQYDPNIQTGSTGPGNFWTNWNPNGAF